MLLGHTLPYGPFLKGFKMSDFVIDSTDLLRIPKFLKNIKNKNVPKANRRAANTALIYARKLTIKRVQISYKLKRQDLVRSSKKGLAGFLSIVKMRGNRLEGQEGLLNISGRPVNMTRFLPPGKRKPISQKGKTMKGRGKLKFEIKPGQKKTHPHDFVQRGKNGNMLVFRRQKGKKKGKREKLAAQKVPSIPVVLEKTESIEIIRRMTGVRYARNFTRQLNFLINKENK